MSREASKLKSAAIIATAMAFQFTDLFKWQAKLAAPINTGTSARRYRHAGKQQPAGNKLARKLERAGSIYGRVSVVQETFNRLHKDGRLPRYNHGRRVA